MERGGGRGGAGAGVWERQAVTDRPAAAAGDGAVDPRRVADHRRGLHRAPRDDAAAERSGHARGVRAPGVDAVVEDVRGGDGRARRRGVRALRDRGQAGAPDPGGEGRDGRAGVVPAVRERGHPRLDQGRGGVPRRTTGSGSPGPATRAGADAVRRGARRVRVDVLRPRCQRPVSGDGHHDADAARVVCAALARGAAADPRDARPAVVAVGATGVAATLSRGARGRRRGV